MAEQVVNIRERIEKMRTQIYDKTSVNKSDVPEDNISTDNESNPDHKINVENGENKKGSNISKPPVKGEIDDNSKGSIVQINKEGKLTDQEENIEFDQYKEKIKNKPFKTEYSKPQENKDYYNNDERIEYVKPQARKTDNKSYKDYQLNNLVDENKKNVNFEKQSSSFPQFSLNVNNPISWKLMLLIMLMQLLTNIMLVVVLYLK
tara:strand:- start:529 stop:1143 length:615 start_codon:yes stop_codon:yes gene_type:complete